MSEVVTYQTDIYSSKTFTNMNQTNSAPYIGYVRVSSAEQAAKKLSIPSQIEQIVNYAKQNNIQIEKIYQEEQSAFSGKRPVFNEVLQRLKNNKKLWWLIVFKRDRVSRNMSDFDRLDKIVRQNNQDILSVTEPMLNSYLWRYLIRDMQNRAILYSEELSFRVKLGMRKKYQRGEFWGGAIPFGMKIVEWHILPHETKAEIVQYIFELYATGRYGFREVAKRVNLIYQTKLHKWTIETILQNDLYRWVKRVKRTLSNEECVFRWVEKAGEFIEEYKLEYITPIVTEEMFFTCKNIREKRGIVYPKEKPGKNFPKIFQCVCWRSLRRDDKKNIRYLSCSKQINNVFPVRCTEPYTQLQQIQPQIEKIVLNIVGDKEIRAKMKAKVNAEIAKSNDDKNYGIQQALAQINILELKTNELTDEYVKWTIQKELYTQVVQKINEQITWHKTQIRAYQDWTTYQVAGKNVVRFLDKLDKVDDILHKKDKNKKSSQSFSLFFKCIANCVVGGKNIVSYTCFQPFSILQKLWILEWWSILDSNQWPPQCQCGALANWANRSKKSCKLFAKSYKQWVYFLYSMKRIAFTWWWSWGHITPIASLIEYGLQDTEIAHECKLFRFGESDSLEQKTAQQFAEVTFVSIPAGKLRRYFSWKAMWSNIHDAWNGICGIIRSAYLLNKYRIDIVFCKWGYVALPVCIVAYILRIPILMHESDTYAGMTNRLVAKMARVRFVWFPDILAPSRHIWQLLSPRLLDPQHAFQNDIPHKTIVLVMWWSQWAASLFDWLLQYLQTNPQHWFHFFVLLGSKNEKYKELFSTYHHITTFWFISDACAMARLYQISDLAITRGSATSLAEQHLFGIRKIIVPLPRTGGNHQRHNGVRYRDSHKDVLIEQNDNLLTQLTETLNTYATYKKTSQEPNTVELFTPLASVRQELLS
jgi:UDP-N-acetylglucosamine--N-acetylmuramyl-(pentapeptide) pyrophosphoryl-undecaprenol N-acetylglucosamine transferase